MTRRATSAPAVEIHNTEMDSTVQQTNLSVNIVIKLYISQIVVSKNNGTATTKETTRRRTYTASLQLEMKRTMDTYQVIAM